VGVSLLQHAGQMVHQRVAGPGDETRTGAKREQGCIDGGVNGTVRRRRGACACIGGWRVLALGQAVDRIVEQQQVEVDVAAQRMQQMVAADRQEIAVAARHPDIQVRIGQFDAGCDGRGAAVDRVEAVGGDVVGQSCCTADTRDEDDLVRRAPDIGQGGADRLQDGIVAATGTPAHLLVGSEVLRGQADLVHGFSSRAARSPAATVPAVNGWPVTWFRPCASIRYCPRMMERSWPVLSSATTTLR